MSGLRFVEAVGRNEDARGSRAPASLLSHRQGASAIARPFRSCHAMRAPQSLIFLRRTEMPFAKQQADASSENLFSKVPAITLVFWIVKILCTTLGETGGDAVTMSMNLGYLVGTLNFAAFFVVFVCAQVYAKKFHPLLYWITIIATTTVGTTMADFSDRSLGIGYAGGSLLLLGLLMASLGLWYWTMGSVSVDTVSTPKVEVFYWVTIMFSQTLGTALGDWTADSEGLRSEKR